MKMKKVKKTNIIVGSILLVAVIIGIIIVVIANPDTRKQNDKAEKDENGRYLTIVNETEQIINEVHITVGNGTEIEDMKQINPDETSFSIEIPKQYSEYATFTVTLLDRHDLKYVKEITDVAGKGRTEVVITEDDYIEEKGDFWNKVNKWFNGD